MKKTLFFLFIAFIINAQETDTTLNKWIPEFVVKANISQIAFKDWAKGGNDSFTWALINELALNKKTKKWGLKNSLKIAYGRTKSGNEAFRTNNNEIFMESVLSFNVGWNVDPFVSNSLRTQITEGYNYKVKPFTKIADFFDPAYITQSFGFTYDKEELFTTRLGLALQQVITNKYRQYSDDKTTSKVETFKFETGLETVTSSQFNIMEDIDFKTNLRLFTRFEHIDVWDVRFDSYLIAKVNSYINVNINVLLVYEKAQSYRTQVKEALQLGLVYNII